MNSHFNVLVALCLISGTTWAESELAPGGVLIAGNGLVVAGPMGERRSYVPLNRASIPPKFIGTWAERDADCGLRDSVERRSRTLVIQSDHVGLPSVSFTIRAVYVLAESTVSFEDMNSGRKLVIDAAEHQDTDRILLSLLPGGKFEAREFASMSLNANGALSLTRHSLAIHGKLIKCATPP